MDKVTLKSICEQTLQTWSMIGGASKDECFKRLFEMADFYEDKDFFDQYYSYGIENETRYLTLDIEQIQKRSDIEYWLGNEYDYDLDSDQWDDIDFLINRGVTVQCVSIFMTMGNLDAYKVGYLNLLPNKARRLTYSLACSKDEDFLQRLGTQELENRLKDGYQHSLKHQKSFDFYVNNKLAHTFSSMSTVG